MTPYNAVSVLLRKLLPYRSFGRFSALHIGGTFLLIYVLSSCNVQVSGTRLPIDQWFSFPDIWQVTAALTRWLYYIPAFFVVQIVCAELELKLVRAQVIAGLERREIIAGWVLQNALLTAMGTAAALLAAAVIGHRTGAGFGAGAAVQASCGLIIYGLAFLNFALLAAVVLRRPVPALAALFIAAAVEPALGVVLERYNLAAVRDYLPFAALASLVPLPGLGGTLSLASLTTVMAVVFGSGAALLAWLRLERLDL